jgi:diadenosine tetraphosphate (Ap4A) HIT family hydrolase
VAELADALVSGTSGRKALGVRLSSRAHMIDCVFCTLPELKTRTIVRGDLAWAFPTNIPITPGHVEGFHQAWNEGKVAGQSVPHFHLHVVPRKQGDEGITEYEPRKFLYRPGSREETPSQELESIAKQIKEKIS